MEKKSWVEEAKYFGRKIYDKWIEANFKKKKLKLGLEIFYLSSKIVVWLTSD